MVPGVPTCSMTKGQAGGIHGGRVFLFLARFAFTLLLAWWKQKWNLSVLFVGPASGFRLGRSLELIQRRLWRRPRSPSPRKVPDGLGKSCLRWESWAPVLEWRLPCSVFLMAWLWPWPCSGWACFPRGLPINSSEGKTPHWRKRPNGPWRTRGFNRSAPWRWDYWSLPVLFGVMFPSPSSRP